MKKILLGILALVVLGGAIFGVVSALSEEMSDSQTSLTFVGDIMLDRYIKQKAEGHGYEHVVSGFDEVFQNSDTLVGNLESPVTDFPSVSNVPVGHPDNMRFSAPPESVRFLSHNNFDLVSIGNNHITDFGRPGVEQTETHLDNAGILHTGNPYQSLRETVVKHNNISVSFIPYNQFLGHTAEETVSLIERARETRDHIVVLAHWGEEYQTEPSQTQRDLAHQFVNAGANIIIGTHPHVIQPSETYNGSVIYYSLGNFVFDQYWHEAVWCGLVVRFDLSRDRIESIATTTARMKPDGTTVREACGQAAYTTSILPDQQPQPKPKNEVPPEPKGSETAVVSRVIDGDTIELANGETVRYIGIDTPETVHPAKPAECYGAEASAANKDLVEGREVRLVRDISNRDKYDRLLRYVYVDDVFVNRWLVENGYAYSSSYPPDVAHQNEFQEAQQRARQNTAGLWGGCNTQRKNQNEKSKNNNGDECVIKGNISYNDSEKIYHTPNCPYYSQTVINEEGGERWFCSESEARDAGWRKAYNCP